MILWRFDAPVKGGCWRGGARESGVRGSTLIKANGREESKIVGWGL